MVVTPASHQRQLEFENRSGFHGVLKVTTAPIADATMPTIPLRKSSSVRETRTSSNFFGNARLTRKMSANSSTIDRHQMTVTAAWKIRYTWLGKFELDPQGPKVTIAKIDASTVCT